MNMQQMMIQAQKMQRELKKTLDELAKKEFSLTFNIRERIILLSSIHLSFLFLSRSLHQFDKVFLGRTRMVWHIVSPLFA